MFTGKTLHTSHTFGGGRGGGSKALTPCFYKIRLLPPDVSADTHTHEYAPLSYVGVYSSAATSYFMTNNFYSITSVSIIINAEAILYCFFNYQYVDLDRETLALPSVRISFRRVQSSIIKVLKKIRSP